MLSGKELTRFKQNLILLFNFNNNYVNLSKGVLICEDIFILNINLLKIGLKVLCVQQQYNKIVNIMFNNNNRIYYN